MNHAYPHTDTQPPSVSSAFFRGFGSYALNGALIMGLLFTVTASAGALLPAVMVGKLGIATVTTLPFLASATLATLATGLFGGLMSAKRALFETNAAPSNAIVPVPMTAPAVAPALAPAISPLVTPSLDAAPDAPAASQATSWAEKTGRNGTGESRIQEIINNGTLNDKDRASAILAARQEETAADMSASRR